MHSDFGSSNSMVTVVSDSAKPPATSQQDDPMSDDEQVRLKKVVSINFETFFNGFSLDSFNFPHGQMIIADENPPNDHEIDLKCAEKVTDSDVEESNFDSEDNQTRSHKVHVLSLLILQRSYECVK